MRPHIPQLSKFRSSGFSVVEVLVYLAIFVIVTTASVSFLFSLKDFIGQYQLETALYRSSTGVLEPVVLAIRQADTVDVVNTVEEVAAGKLTVESAATTTTFTQSGSTVALEINGVAYGDMTRDDVVVNGFTVHYYPLAGGRQFVRIQLDLTATVNSSSKSETFYAGAIVRGAM